MWTRSVISVSVVVLFSSVMPASAIDFVCDGGVQANPDSIAAGPGPQEQVRLIFVHGPGKPDHDPVYMGEIWEQLSTFLVNTSGGAYQAFITTLYRPGANVGKSWELPRPSEDYRNPCGSAVCWTDANQDILLAVHDEWSDAGVDDIWSNVDRLLIFYEFNSCPFEGPCPRGFGLLGVSGIPNFAVKGGATLGLASGELDAMTLSDRLLRGTAHEFGHALDFDDTGSQQTQPPCGSPPAPTRFNIGRYDLMRSPSAGVPKSKRPVNPCS